MNAGKSITFLPNTNIQYGATYLGKIENCERSREIIKGENQRVKSRTLVENNILISPNPSSDFLNIKSDSNIKNIFVTDINGRKIDVSINNDKVNIINLPSGVYLINIETKEGISVHKFIKK